MSEKRAETILIWMQLIEGATLRRAFEGLTQDEFMWKPHPGAWGIARREECQTPTPLGAERRSETGQRSGQTAPTGGRAGSVPVVKSGSGAPGWYHQQELEIGVRLSGT